MRLLCRLSDGKSVKAASSSNDSNGTEEVSGVFELWTCLRAFFTTLAHTSIDQKDCFGFGECEQFVDQIFQWLHLRHSGQRAPIQFYIDAFNSSGATFQSAVRANRTLNSVIGNLWSIFGQCLFQTVKWTTLWRVVNARVGGETQVPRITKLDTREHFWLQETSSPNETVLWTSYESSPMSLEKVSSTAVKKTVIEINDQTLSNDNVTSTNGNPDGNCMVRSEGDIETLDFPIRRGTNGSDATTHNIPVDGWYRDHTTEDFSIYNVSEQLSKIDRRSRVVYFFIFQAPESDSHFESLHYTMHTIIRKSFRYSSKRVVNWPRLDISIESWVCDFEVDELTFDEIGLDLFQFSRFFVVVWYPSSSFFLISHVVRSCDTERKFSVSVSVVVILSGTPSWNLRIGTRRNG